MNPQEANKIIAEYLGLKVMPYEQLKGAKDTALFGTYWTPVLDNNTGTNSEQWMPLVYHISIDKIVPVLEKLAKYYIFRIELDTDLPSNEWIIYVHKPVLDSEPVVDTSCTLGDLPGAVAIAAAQAIQELL